VAGQAGAWPLQAIAGRGFDLLRRGQVELDGVHLAPYQARWIDLDPDGPA
jgi:hypothetical protein